MAQRLGFNSKPIEITIQLLSTLIIICTYNSVCIIIAMRVVKFFFNFVLRSLKQKLDDIGS